jgi:hypothetical protein
MILSTWVVAQMVLPTHAEYFRTLAEKFGQDYRILLGGR